MKLCIENNYQQGNLLLISINKEIISFVKDIPYVS